MSAHPESITVAVDKQTAVSGLLQVPASPLACLVLAHGAGAGMSHPFLAAMADELERHQVATLRYQFPYMEKGLRRPDSPLVAQSTVRAAVARALELLPGVPLFAGGKSFGGRMTSAAQAHSPLQEVRGLVFVGFPLHPAGKPSIERAEHLFKVQLPMLFLQGTRDTLADLQLLKPVIQKLAPGATLRVIQDADHSFHLPAKTGRKDAEARSEIVATMIKWMRKTAKTI